MLTKLIGGVVGLVIGAVIVEATCQYREPSSAMKDCVVKLNCMIQSGSCPSNAFDVKRYPDGCVQSANNVNCSSRTTPCWHTVECEEVLNEDVGGYMCVQIAGTEGAWVGGTERFSEYCGWTG